MNRKETSLCMASGASAVETPGSSGSPFTCNLSELVTSFVERYKVFKTNFLLLYYSFSLFYLYATKSEGLSSCC